MAGSYNGVAVPSDGKKISYAGGKYDVPNNPIIPFIEGRRNRPRHLESLSPRLQRRRRKSLQRQAPRGVV